ncbi:MAG: hypothetical protein HPY65_00720 [Syntrophaceae bacterium]|nr:hypothetical protein [Syntrophaceae bacterium]
MTTKLVTIISVFLLFLMGYSAQAFEVKGIAGTTTFCQRGKCVTTIDNSEVIYEVNLDVQKVTRKAVLNKSIPNNTIGGLQSDNTEYAVFYDNKDLETRKLFNEQRIIKAIGKTALLDGFETIVIGDDFIHTSRSSSDYFVIYYYKRVGTIPIR